METWNCVKMIGKLCLVLSLCGCQPNPFQHQNRKLEQQLKKGTELFGYLYFIREHGNYVLPVVYTKQPEFYLNHNIHGKKDRFGTPMIDGTIQTRSDHHLVIYAHSSRSEDGNFTFLKNYLDRQYFDRYNCFEFVINQQSHPYQVVMFARLLEDNILFDTLLSRQGVFNLQDKQQILYLNQEIEYQDEPILTLITCDSFHPDYRFVLQAIDIG